MGRALGHKTAVVLTVLNHSRVVADNEEHRIATGLDDLRGIASTKLGAGGKTKLATLIDGGVVRRAVLCNERSIVVVV